MGTWGKVGVIAGIIAALAAVVGLTRLGSSSTTNTQSGTGNCIVNGQSNTVDCPGGSNGEEAILKNADEHKAVAPTGAGPWPFVVVRDMNIGLKVRSTDTVDGQQIGGLAHLHTAWVVCKQRSGFDPEGLGDLWYKIKWGNQGPSTAFFESETGASGTGWVHSYYLSPVNHNGIVPDC